MLKRIAVAAAAVATTAALAAVPPATAGGDHHSTRGEHGRFGHRHDHNAGRRGCRPGTHSAWDEEWLQTSLKGDLFEIAGGKLAQSRASSSQVKALGAKLESDHSKSFEDGAKLAKQLGLEVPGEPTPTEQWELGVLSSLSGAAFDSAYTSLEVKDHEQDIEETKAEIEKGCNSQIRGDAKEELPMLEEHLKLAEAASGAPGAQQQRSGSDQSGGSSHH